MLKLIKDLDSVIEHIDNKYNEGLGLLSLQMYVETGNIFLSDDMKVTDILQYYSIDDIRQYLEYKNDVKGSKVVVKRNKGIKQERKMENFNLDIKPKVKEKVR